MEVTSASQELIQSVFFTFGIIFVTEFLGAVFRAVLERWIR